MSPREELRKTTDDLVRNLPAWCERGRASTRHHSRAVFAGEFHSRRIVSRGMERSDPRVFTLDDEPGMIDLGRLPESAARNFMEAVLEGKLRVVPAIQTIESEFTIVVDLSRSMLNEFFDPRISMMTRQDATRLRALFYTVASFLHLAARLGFRLRVIRSHGHRIEEERGGPAKALLHETLLKMRTSLLHSHEVAENDPANRECFNLVWALQAALAVKARGVVLVVSDFLDPAGEYVAFLNAAMKRHQVILADVSSPAGRNFPVPRWWNIETMRQSVREGPWHLEEGTNPRPIGIGVSKTWNRRQIADLREVQSVARRAGSPYLKVGEIVERSQTAFQSCYTMASEQLLRLR